MVTRANPKAAARLNVTADSYIRCQTPEIERSGRRFLPLRIDLTLRAFQILSSPGQLRLAVMTISELQVSSIRSQASAQNRSQQTSGSDEPVAMVREMKPTGASELRRGKSGSQTSKRLETHVQSCRQNIDGSRLPPRTDWPLRRDLQPPN